MTNSTYFRVLKNTFWNLWGGSSLIFLQIVITPYIVHKLGTEIYGIWSLAWILLSYFGFLELGLGTACVKFISEYYNKHDFSNCSKIYWTSLIITVIQGIIGSIIIIGFAPLMVKKFFSISSQLIPMTTLVIQLSAIGIIASFLLGTAQAVSAALERFDWINKITISKNIVQFLGIAIILYLGGSIIHMLLFSFLLQIMTLVIYYLLGLKLIPELNNQKLDKKAFRVLLKFGGWVTLSSILAPTLDNIEKLFIGSFLSVAFLTYYYVPFSLLSRLFLLSNSLSTALFPAFSEMSSREDHATLQSIVLQATRILSASVGFISILLIIFAKDFLTFWLGQEFALHATTPMKILCAAFWINIIAHIPFAFLRAHNKPHIPALCHLIELFLYLPIAYWLIKLFSLNGAALAWTFRVSIDTTLLIIATTYFLKFPINKILKAIFNIGLLVPSILMIIIWCAQNLWGLSIWFVIINAFIFSILEILIIWHFILRTEEKQIIQTLFFQFKR